MLCPLGDWTGESWRGALEGGFCRMYRSFLEGEHTLLDQNFRNLEAEFNKFIQERKERQVPGPVPGPVELGGRTNPACPALKWGSTLTHPLAPQSRALVGPSRRKPCESDFETIKLISNGAYG